MQAWSLSLRGPSREAEPLSGNYCYLPLVLLTRVLKEWSSTATPCGPMPSLIGLQEEIIIMRKALVMPYKEGFTWKHPHGPSQ